MDFAEVLGKAWRIVWKHKVLWVFGIFAGCGRGGGGGGGGTGWQQSYDSGNPFPEGMTSGAGQFADTVSRWISDNLWIVALIVVAFVILVVLSVFLGTVGRIGLIRGTLKADGGAERLSFGEIFGESLPFFWRVFLLGLAIGLLALVVFGCLALFGVVTMGIGFLVALPLICVLLPVFWALGLVVQLSTAAMVIENDGIVDGVRRGWGVLTRNVGPVLLVWLITAVIGVAVGIALAIPAVLTLIPAMMVWMASGADRPTAMAGLAVLCFVAYLPVLIVATGILTAYLESVWALTYLRLAKPPTGGKIAQAVPTNA